jgi:hypothetical protein
MAEIKPDKILAELATKLAKAKTDAEIATIQEQINQRQSEITAESGGAAFGGRGMYIPANAAVGTTILQPTYEQGVYTKTTITSDKTVDQYGRTNLGNAVTLYGEDGKPLSAAEAAKTETGLNFAAAGRDIGFGAGFIAPGVRPDIEFATFNSGRANSPDAAVSAGLGGSTGNFTSSFEDSSTDDSTIDSLAVTDGKKGERVSAYNLLYDEFDRYGLGTLVSDIRNILVEGSLDPAEFALKVRGTDAYKARFIANEARLAKGLKALSPAAYIALEDQYQEVMRQYGLPESYYAKTGTGVQEGFRKLIENDVSNIELEDRISTAQKRVINANPEVTQAIRQFYPDITNADILAYTLDPKNAIENIKRKVTTAEIGGAAIQSGLQTGLTRAEQLQAAGVTKETAQQGYGTIGGGLQRGSQLASIYGEDPYTQTTAETEVFNIAGAQEARKQRQKITGLEKATFGGQSGISSGALTRDRAGGY